MKTWSCETRVWNSQLAQCNNNSSELFVKRQSWKSGGTSHNQKAFEAKFPFNYKVKFCLVNKRISAPRKIPLAGKWSLLWMYSVKRNLACVVKEMNASSTQCLRGSLREFPLSAMEQDAVQISLVLPWKWTWNDRPHNSTFRLLSSSYDMSIFKLKYLRATSVYRNGQVPTFLLCVPSNVGISFGNPVCMYACPRGFLQTSSMEVAGASTAIFYMVKGVYHIEMNQLKRKWFKENITISLKEHALPYIRA